MQQLFSYLRHHYLVILLTLSVTFLFLTFTHNRNPPDFIREIENFLYDYRVVKTMPNEIDPSIVIIDIDERSLSEIGRWPWSRDRLAKMVNELFDYYGVALIGFDIFFRERDDSSGLKILEQLAKGELAGINEYQSRLSELQGILDYDGQFIDAIRKGPVILGFTFFGEEENVEVLESGVLPAPALSQEDIKGKTIFANSAVGFGGNIAEIQQAAMGAGHITPQIDTDGRVRRVPMVMRYKDDYYGSLSLSIVQFLFGVEQVKPLFSEFHDDKGYPSLEALQLGDFQTIPVDANVQALVPFRGDKNSFPYVSAADVIRGRADKSALEGAIVIVGTSSKGLVDLRPTPVNREYPGVEIHANLISGILEERVMRYTEEFEYYQLLLTGLLLALILPALSPVYAVLFTLSLFGLNIGFNYYLWTSKMVAPLASTFVLILILFLLTMFYGFFVERRGKKQLSGLFGQYVPPELVDEMSQDPLTYTQDAQSKEMSVLFTDVRNFTTISEGLSPQQLSDLMDAYLTPMTKIIHDNRGTIDKYIGDAIMAFWNAPVEDPNHAHNAVKTGLEMLERTTAIREEFLDKGWPEIRIGAGINTGIMSVGDMGSQFRMAYTVLGDSVNLGSRLEGLTKGYGVEMIVSETTKTAAAEYTYRELDVVRVKGKDKPISIYEPIALRSEISDEELKELALHEQALNSYRQQDWDTAEAQFRQLQQMVPDRVLYGIYLERIDEFRTRPPGEDWDGVYTHTTK